MKFSDMPYVRPDFEAARRDITELTAGFLAAESFEAADGVFLAMNELSSKLDTMFSIAYVRNSINTADDFYDAEMKYLDEQGPMLQEHLQNWTNALLASPFRAQLEEKYGRLMFVNAEMSLKTFSPEIIGELQQENRVEADYVKLIASAQIPFEGGTYTISQLSPLKQDADDRRRRAAWDAEGNFYNENSEKLDEYYDELVRLRDTMAKKLGYESYVTLGYYRMTRNSYSREDVERFREAVVRHVVPVADRIYRQQAARTGASYPLTFADAALMFRSGNARPQGTPEDILAHGRKFYHELSPETAEFIDFMYDNELLDVLSRKGKAAGGYCTSLPEYKAPFIFANFNGTSHDVEVITHEAGHAFAGYTARNIVPLENQSPTLESCEIHSMSMEFFAWPWEEGFFGKDTDKFYYSHLAGALTFIPYGTMVDHFQHVVYEKPQLTPAERHGVWRELLGVYMPWMKLGEVPFYGEGKGWQRQTHIYRRPFYYIDYCLAQTVALQFWALMMHDRREAWQAYMKLVRLAGTRSFTELVAAAGLDTPFGDGALATVCRAANDWLDAFDAEKLK
mgnify:CR=1 FL=1